MSQGESMVYLRLKDNVADAAKLLPFNVKGDFEKESFASIAKVWLLAGIMSLDDETHVLELAIHDKEVCRQIREDQSLVPKILGMSKGVAQEYDSAMACNDTFESFLEMMDDKGIQVAPGRECRMPDLNSEWWIDLLVKNLGFPHEDALRAQISSRKSDAPDEEEGEPSEMKSDLIKKVEDAKFGYKEVKEEKIKLLKELEELRRMNKAEKALAEKARQELAALRTTIRNRNKANQGTLEGLIANAAAAGPNVSGPIAYLDINTLFNRLNQEGHDFPSSTSDHNKVAITIARVNTLMAEALVQSSNYNYKEIKIKGAMSNEDMLLKIREIVSTPETLDYQIKHIGDNIVAINSQLKSASTRPFGSVTVPPAVPPAPQIPGRSQDPNVKQPSEMSEQEIEEYLKAFYG